MAYKPLWEWRHLQLLGHELPNDSGTSCVGDVVSGIRRVFQSVFQAVYEKTAWVVPTSPEKYFTQFRNFRNGYIEEIMFEDPTIQNEQIIERLRQICLQNTQGQIDNIFIGKQYFCSYDNLYDESKCTELYARLEAKNDVRPVVFELGPRRSIISPV